MKLELKKDKRTLLDKEIDHLLETLPEDVCSERYSAGVDNLKKMYEAKAAVQTEKPKLDPNQVLKVGAYIAGLLLVLEYEQVRVIYSKAFSMLGRVL